MEIQGIIIGDLEVYFRIFISACLGFLIGWDRTSKSKPAGVKTYMFVATSCALITLVSIYSVDLYGREDNVAIMDPMRLAAQIVTGLGFLGAGVILKEGLHVKGLTSAAMIFFVGAVGIGIGAGFYGFVIFSVIVVMTLSKLGNHIEKKHVDHPQSDETI